MRIKHGRALRWAAAISIGCTTVTALALSVSAEPAKHKPAPAKPKHRRATAIAEPAVVARIASPTPKPNPAPRPAAKAPRFDTRQIVMRPPYDLHRKQVALSCGFHDSCKRFPSRSPHYFGGDGLDWNDNNGTVPETKSVFFTASAHAAVAKRIAAVRFEFHPAGRDFGYPCNTLVAKVYSMPDRKPLFRVMYEHVVPVRGLKGFDIVAQAQPFVPARHKATLAPPPNVVRKIGNMREDPCPFFTHGQLHAHVEPQGHQRFVSYERNGKINAAGLRVVPDVNGCLGACDGPVYPGPRWSAPYSALWTYRWSWVTDTRSGRVKT